MPTKAPSTSGLGAIARAAGVTRAAVSYALRNKPGVSKETRERILQIAKDQGYTPDARLASWMATVRESKSKDLLPIAWLNHHSHERDAWHKHRYLSPYLEGARERANELGYRLEEIWTRQSGMNMRRLSKILYQRGIEGVLVTQFVTHFRLDWQYFAGAVLEHHLVAPVLRRLEADSNYNLFLAFRAVKKLGYKRIGICLDECLKKPENFTFWPAMQHLSASLRASERIPPLLYQWYSPERMKVGKKQAVDWIRQHKPEVIVCHSNKMVEWTREAGFKVPEEIGVVHLATDDDVSDWAGVCSNRRTIGATAVDWVVSKILKRDFGLPAIAPTILIRGSWHVGNTLIA